MDLNRAMIIGNLTRDPEVRTTANGQTVANLGVATNRVYTDANGQKQETVEYHNVVAWGRLAEICAQYLGKGRRTFIEGRLQTRDWEGQDGVKRYRTEIVASNLIMLDRKGNGAMNAAPMTSMPTAASAPAAPGMPMTDNPPLEEPTEEIKVENIPF